MRRMNNSLTEIEKEREQTKFFRKMGYTFSSLVQHYLQEQHFQSMLKERLYFIEKMGGQVCICSAFSVEKNGVDGTNVVPVLWCMVKDNQEKPCPYAKPTAELICKAVEMRRELKVYNEN